MIPRGINRCYLERWKECFVEGNYFNFYLLKSESALNEADKVLQSNTSFIILFIYKMYIFQVNHKKGSLVM